MWIETGNFLAYLLRTNTSKENREKRFSSPVRSKETKVALWLKKSLLTIYSLSVLLGKDGWDASVFRKLRCSVRRIHLGSSESGDKHTWNYSSHSFFTFRVPWLLRDFIEATFLRAFDTFQRCFHNLAIYLLLRSLLAFGWKKFLK